jgi:hypothetical protein
MTGVGAPWEFMGSSPERKGKGERGRGRAREGGGRLLGEEAPWGWLLGAARCPCMLSVRAERLCCS